jgi:hypothetical protein
MQRMRLIVPTLLASAWLVALAQPGPAGNSVAPTRAQLPPAPLVLKGQGHATVPVDGVWQFHLGDNPSWASPGLEDSGWGPIEAGRPWEGQGNPGYTGFAWYRRHLVLAPGETLDGNLALLLPNVQDACEVYWNGALVGSLGKLPPHPVWYLEAFPKVVMLGPARSGTLAIRIWKAPHVYLSYPDEGGLIAMPRAGGVEAIANLSTIARYRWLQASQFRLALALLSAIVSLLAALAWLRNRERFMLFWLAIAMVYPVAMVLITDIPALVSFRVFYGLVGVVVAINDAALWFLLLYLLGLDHNQRLVRMTRIVALSIVALDLVDPIMLCFDWTRLFPRFFLLADVLTTAPAELLELYGIVLIVFGLRKRLDAARWMLAISVLLIELYQAAADITGLGVRWTHWTLDQKLSATLFTAAGNPFNARTIMSTLVLISILYAAWRYSIEQGQRQSALEREFQNARELQQVLIPEDLPDIPGYALTTAYKPALEVGGDFFQIIPLKNSQTLIVLGDVSGKGLRAAMTVSMIVGAVRALAETTNRPAELLERLNGRLYGRLQGGFTTAIALRLDPIGECLIASAGHPSPFLNDREVDLPGALPLGLALTCPYEECSIQLCEFDRLALYTDGLLEARNSAGELYGFERLKILFATMPTAEEATQTAQAFGQDDDVTVLTLARII